MSARKAIIVNRVLSFGFCRPKINRGLKDFCKIGRYRKSVAKYSYKKKIEFFSEYLWHKKFHRNYKSWFETKILDNHYFSENELNFSLNLTHSRQILITNKDIGYKYYYKFFYYYGLTGCLGRFFFRRYMLTVTHVHTNIPA